MSDYKLSKAKSEYVWLVYENVKYQYGPNALRVLLGAALATSERTGDSYAVEVLDKAFPDIDATLDPRTSPLSQEKYREASKFLPKAECTINTFWDLFSHPHVKLT